MGGGDVIVVVVRVVDAGGGGVFITTVDVADVIVVTVAVVVIVVGVVVIVVAATVIAVARHKEFVEHRHACMIHPQSMHGTQHYIRFFCDDTEALMRCVGTYCMRMGTCCCCGSESIKTITQHGHPKLRALVQWMMANAGSQKLQFPSTPLCLGHCWRGSIVIVRELSSYMKVPPTDVQQPVRHEKVSGSHACLEGGDEQTTQSWEGGLKRV